MRLISWAVENEARVHWQLHLLPGRVSSRDDGRESAENVTCFNFSKQRCCIAFFSLYCMQTPLEERGVGFCTAFVPWLPEWPHVKPERTGGGVTASIKCHTPCLLFVYLQNGGHRHLFLSHHLSIFPPVCPLYFFINSCSLMTLSLFLYYQTVHMLVEGPNWFKTCDFLQVL